MDDKPLNHQRWEYEAKNLSEGSVTDIHNLIKKSLKDEDDGKVTNLGVREHRDWKQQADIYEAAMGERGINFEPIDWTES